jgi:hypothetical protein
MNAGPGAFRCDANCPVDTVVNIFLRTRYVQVAIPTPFDSAAHNGLEQYEWDDKEKRIKVKYTFNDGSFTGSDFSVI